MSKAVIILGDGGHAKVVADLCLLLDMNILGVTSLDQAPGSYFWNEIKVLGDDGIIKQYDPEKVGLVNGLGSLKATAPRMELFLRMKALGFQFLILKHPSAYVSSNAKIGEGVQVFANSVIQADAVIEENVLVNNKVCIDHDSIVQRHVHLAPGVTVCGNVVIGSESHIGCGATIINNVEIGHNVFVAGGALINSSSEDNVRLKGVPAKKY